MPPGLESSRNHEQTRPLGKRQRFPGGRLTPPAGRISRRVMFNIEMPNVITTIQALITLFRPNCKECTTLTELAELAADHTRWRMGGRELFHQIREKTLSAERTGDRVLVAQYLFEEACAKTLTNIPANRATFDTDSPSTSFRMRSP